MALPAAPLLRIALLLSCVASLANGAGYRAAVDVDHARHSHGGHQHETPQQAIASAKKESVEEKEAVEEIESEGGDDEDQMTFGVDQAKAAPLAAAAPAVAAAPAAPTPQQQIAARPAKSGTAGKQGAQSKGSSSVTAPAQANVLGQLGQLSSEFKQLREDDAAHVHKLLFNVRLRDKLRHRFIEEEQTLKADNDMLISEIHAIQDTKHVSGNFSSEDLRSLANLTAAVRAAPAPGSMEAQEKEDEKDSASFLSRRSVGHSDHLRGNSHVGEVDEELARGALNTIDKLKQQVAEVRAKDQQEVAALRANARNRERLKAVIHKQQEQLMDDGDALMGSLNQVRQMAAPPSVAARTEVAVKAPKSVEIPTAPPPSAVMPVPQVSYAAAAPASYTTPSFESRAAAMRAGLEEEEEPHGYDPEDDA